jgi:hypothetical protein
MTIDSTRTQLRAITFLGAGAALLAVIGYLLMKSDRKKPRRKSSKSIPSNDCIDDSNSVLVNDNNNNIKQQLQDINNTDNNNQNNDLIKLDLTLNNINYLTNESSYSLLSNSLQINDSYRKNSDGFDEEEVEVDEDDEEEESNKQFISSGEMDKLSDASSDSGNGQSDIVQMYNCINEYEEDNNNNNNKNTTTINNNSTDDDETKTEPLITTTTTTSTSSTSSPTPPPPSPKQSINKTDQSKVSSSSITSSSSSLKPTTTQTILPVTKTGKIKNSKINFEPNKKPSNHHNKHKDTHEYLKNNETTTTTTSTKQQEQELTQKHNKSLNTSTISDESKNNVEDLVVYEFNFPRRYCGKLIGKNGVHVDSIRSKTHTQIAVRNDPNVEDLQVVCVSGRLEDVDAALDTISMRFPVQLYPQISFRPISKPIVYRRYNPEKKSLFEQSKVLVASNMFVELADVMKITTATTATATTTTDNNKLKQLDSNTRFTVHVTAVVSGAHVFIQLPTHSTYENLQKLDENMLKAYSDLNEPVPSMIEPIEYGTICAAPTSYGWHRAIVTNYQTIDDATSMASFTSLNITNDDISSLSCGIATVKFLDYGGYLNIPANQLRQLRFYFNYYYYYGFWFLFFDSNNF